jgi:hypothetical protein
MQTGGYPQSGGFDPGLSALIGALLTGGIGAYGYSKESRSTEDLAAARLESVYKERLLDAEKTKAQAATTLGQVSAANREVTNLKAERDKLAAALAALKGKVESSSGPALAFQSASAATLKDAIPFVIEALKAKYPQLVSTPADEAKIKKVLEYPTTYQAKLERLTLSAFYTKQVSIVLQQIADKPKGGRRRYRRRGGAPTMAQMPETPAASSFATDPADAADADAAVQEAVVRAAPPVSTNAIPSYDEFATIYEEAIRKATSTEFSREEKRQSTFKEGVDKKVQEKKDAVAAKAAQAIIPKFEKAIQEGETVIKDNATLVGILSAERQEAINTKKRELTNALNDARELIGVPATPTPAKKRFGFFGGAATLREVKTEAEWTEMNTPTKATDLLQKVKDATKAYVDEVKKLSKEEKKSFDVPKVEFGLPKIPIPSLSNPFAPIAKRLGEAKTAADQAAIVRKETKNAVLFMKDILKKVDTALNEVVLSEKATARRKKGGAVDPDAFKPRREMPGYDSIGIQALAGNLKAVARGGKETIGGKTFDWSEKPDGELHPLSFYLAQLNTSVFSGTVDLFLAATTGKSREFSKDVFLAAGEQYALVRTYLEDVVKGLKNPELIRATRLERLAIGAEEGTSAVRKIATSAVDGIMGLVKKVSASLVGVMPGAPVPIAVTTDVETKTKELIALHGVDRIKRVLTRLEAKIPSFPVEKQAGLIAVVEAAKKVVEEAEASGETTPPASPEEVAATEEAVDEAVEEEPAAPTPSPFEIEPGLGPIPPGDFSGIPAPVGALPTAESPTTSVPVTPVSEGSNPSTPTLAPQLPPAAQAVVPMEEKGISKARSILIAAQGRTREEKLAAIDEAEEAMRQAPGKVGEQVKLRNMIDNLRKTMGGKRRRKARKSTLKKRRGGK